MLKIGSFGLQLRHVYGQFSCFNISVALWQYLGL